MLTDVEKSCIWTACDEYKRMVSGSGPDALPGLLDKWSVRDFYNTVIDNEEEFKNNILTHPFFVDKDYESLCDIYHNERSLFMYCLQNFLNDKFLGSLVSTSPIGGTIEVNPETMEPITAKPIDTTRDEETENKKEFIKEVMDGVEKKTTLRDFLMDIRSYKQFRDDIEKTMMFINWDKIHQTMKNLKWHWASWTDIEGNEHYNSTPSIYALKSEVLKYIHDMEDWIMKHGDSKHYLCGTGGFEYEMWVCDEGYEDSVTDDYNNRVRLVVRFVLSQYDNGM